MDSMTETAPETTAPEAPAEPAQPVVSNLAPTTLEMCDGCGQGTQALFEIVLISGKTLTLCGHHSRRGGFTDHDRKTHLDNDRRQ